MYVWASDGRVHEAVLDSDPIVTVCGVASKALATKQEMEKGPLHACLPALPMTGTVTDPTAVKREHTVMPPRKKAAAAPKPTTEELDSIRSAVHDDIDRIVALAREGDKGDQIETVREEADAKIRQLPRGQHTALRKQLTEAVQTTPASTELAAESSKELQAAEPILDETIEKFREALDLQLKGQTVASQFAALTIKALMCVTDKRGLPDLNSMSGAAYKLNARQLEGAKAVLRERNAEWTEDELSRAVDSFWSGVRVARQDERAKLALSYVDLPDDFARDFPQLADDGAFAELFPEAAEAAGDTPLNPAERLSYAYRIDLLGSSGRKKLQRRINALAKAADKAEKVNKQTEAEQLRQEARELMAAAPVMAETKPLADPFAPKTETAEPLPDALRKLLNSFAQVSQRFEQGDPMAEESEDEQIQIQATVLTLERKIGELKKRLQS